MKNEMAEDKILSRLVGFLWWLQKEINGDLDEDTCKKLFEIANSSLSFSGADIKMHYFKTNAVQYMKNEGFKHKKDPKKHLIDAINTAVKNPKFNDLFENPDVAPISEVSDGETWIKRVSAVQENAEKLLSETEGSRLGAPTDRECYIFKLKTECDGNPVSIAWERGTHHEGVMFLLVSKWGDQFSGISKDSVSSYPAGSTSGDDVSLSEASEYELDTTNHKGETIYLPMKGLPKHLIPVDVDADGGAFIRNPVKTKELIRELGLTQERLKKCTVNPRRADGVEGGLEENDPKINNSRVGRRFYKVEARLGLNMHDKEPYDINGFVVIFPDNQEFKAALDATIIDGFADYWKAFNIVVHNVAPRNGANLSEPEAGTLEYKIYEFLSNLPQNDQARSKQDLDNIRQQLNAFKALLDEVDKTSGKKHGGKVDLEFIKKPYVKAFYKCCAIFDNWNKGEEEVYMNAATHTGSMDYNDVVASFEANELEAAVKSNPAAEEAQESGCGFGFFNGCGGRSGKKQKLDKQKGQANHVQLRGQLASGVSA